MASKKKAKGDGLMLFDVDPDDPAVLDLATTARSDDPQQTAESIGAQATPKKKRKKKSSASSEEAVSSVVTSPEEAAAASPDEVPQATPTAAVASSVEVPQAAEASSVAASSVAASSVAASSVEALQVEEVSSAEVEPSAVASPEEAPMPLAPVEVALSAAPALGSPEEAPPPAPAPSPCLASTEPSVVASTEDSGEVAILPLGAAMCSPSEVSDTAAPCFTAPPIEQAPTVDEVSEDALAAPTEAAPFDLSPWQDDTLDKWRPRLFLWSCYDRTDWWRFFRVYRIRGLPPKEAQVRAFLDVSALRGKKGLSPEMPAKEVNERLTVQTSCQNTYFHKDSAGSDHSHGENVPCPGVVGRERDTIPLEDFEVTLRVLRRNKKPPAPTPQPAPAAPTARGRNARSEDAPVIAPPAPSPETPIVLGKMPEQKYPTQAEMEAWIASYGLVRLDCGCVVAKERASSWRCVGHPKHERTGAPAGPFFWRDIVQMPAETTRAADGESERMANPLDAPPLVSNSPLPPRTPLPLSTDTAEVIAERNGYAILPCGCWVEKKLAESHKCVPFRLSPDDPAELKRQEKRAEAIAWCRDILDGKILFVAATETKEDTSKLCVYEGPEPQVFEHPGAETPETRPPGWGWDGCATCPRCDKQGAYLSPRGHHCPRCSGVPQVSAG